MSDDETVEEISKQLGGTALMGNAAIAAFAVKKFKTKKTTPKKTTPQSSAKSSKPSSRTNSFKYRPRSFLEENIKLAGNKELHQKHIIKDDDESRNSTIAIPNASAKKALRRAALQISTFRKERRLSIRETKAEEADQVRLHYSKQQQDLQRAYSVLLKEYKRKVEIRQNINQKFGRANKKLKGLLIANKMKSAMQEDSEASTEAIDQPLLLKGNNNDQSKKNKRTSKYKNFDDPDRI